MKGAFSLNNPLVGTVRPPDSPQKKQAEVRLSRSPCAWPSESNPSHSSKSQTRVSRKSPRGSLDRQCRRQSKTSLLETLRVKESPVFWLRRLVFDSFWPMGGQPEPGETAVETLFVRFEEVRMEGLNPLPGGGIAHGIGPTLAGKGKRPHQAKDPAFPIFCKSLEWGRVQR